MSRPNSIGVLLVLLSVLCLNILASPVSSSIDMSTEDPSLLSLLLQNDLSVSETTSTIRVSIVSPEYILVERVGEVKLIISNTEASQREVIVTIESVFGYIRVEYPASELKLVIPPMQDYELKILVRGVSEGEELIVITIVDPLSNHTHRETTYLPVTTLRTIYIYAQGSISLFLIEIARRPLQSISLQLCNISALHLRDNVYVVEIPKIYKKCTLYYEHPFLNGGLGVLLVEDTIYLTVIDPEFSTSIAAIAVILLFPSMLLLASFFTKLDGATGITVFLLYLFVLFSLLHITHVFLSLGDIVLAFDIGVILVKVSMRRKTLNKDKIGTNKKRVHKSIELHRGTSIISRKDAMVIKDEYLELINIIKRCKLPSPLKRERSESIVVPSWLRNNLKNVGMKLPREMYLIDCGYSGCVYECGPYAIKIPKVLRGYLDGTPPTLSRDQALRFEREVSIVSRLEHDNVLKLIDYSTNPPILVYELADGSLQLYKHLELKEVLVVAVQICEGLRYLHSRGIIHGDVKPSNILIVKGVIKLGDLSSVTHLLSVSQGESRIYCTPGYCAPEQLFFDIRFDERRKGFENRVDVYQLANVILYMLGKEPIDANDLSYAELDKRLKDIVIPELKHLLRDMLSPYPWQRPSIDEVEKRLLYIWKKYIKGNVNKE